MKKDLRAWSAIGMLAAGVGLSTAGFCVEPVGEISDSVLWFFAQCLLYAGAALGVTAGRFFCYNIRTVPLCFVLSWNSRGQVPWGLEQTGR